MLNFAKRNIRRTPYQAMVALMVMFLTFLALTIFLILAVASQKTLQFYESKPQVIAFFKDGTEPSDVEAIKKALQRTGKVSDLKYVSKQEALAIYQERNKNKPALLELVTANMLPESLEVSTVNPEDLGPIAEILKKEPVVEEVGYPKDVVDTISTAAKVIRWVGGVAVSFLIIFASLVILMVIGFKIRLRRTEIEIMKLLGASSWFIRGPFVLEGIFYGVTGAIIAWVLSYGLLWYFTPYLQNLLGELNLLPVSPLFMLALLGIEVLIALSIGVFGSYGAVRRYLRI